MKSYRPQQKRKSAFFEYFLKISGPEFLLRENAANLRRRATFFFRDMAHGSFDMELHGQYLMDERLVTLMKEEAQLKVWYYGTHCTALNKMIECSPETNTSIVQTIARKDYDSYIAYSVIYDGLNQFLITRNLSMFDVIANQIKAVKYSL